MKLLLFLKSVNLMPINKHLQAVQVRIMPAFQMLFKLLFPLHLQQTVAPMAIFYKASASVYPATRKSTTSAFHPNSVQSFFQYKLIPPIQTNLHVRQHLLRAAILAIVVTVATILTIVNLHLSSAVMASVIVLWITSCTIKNACTVHTLAFSTQTLQNVRSFVDKMLTTVKIKASAFVEVDTESDQMVTASNAIKSTLS